MNGFNRITLVIWCIFIIESVVSIYDPSIETKTKVLHHDPLLRIPRSSGVQIHDQYSRVQMYKPENSERHFGRSDASQREGRTFNSQEENDVVPHGTECPPGQTGQFPYLMDCRQYLNCWKGRGYIQSCSPGTLFNPETFECDHPSKVVCASMDKPRSDINVRFTKTSARLTDAKPRQYNKNRPYTFESNETPVCPQGESGLFPHPFDCTKFLNCANGITHIQDCGPGTAFNPNIKNCDWPQNVDCESRNSAQQNEYTGEGTIEARNIDEIFQGSATKNVVSNREHRVNDGLTWNEQTRSWHSVGSTYPSQVLEPPTREIRPIYTRPGSITQPDIRRSDTVENNEGLLLRSGSNQEDDNQHENDEDIYSNRRTVQENRPYNREYFKPSQQTPNVPSKPTEMAPLPISEAIKALLRPYYNRNDNKSEPNSEAIKTRLGLTSSEVVVPNKKNDMELILSGEQESLAKNDDSDKYRNRYDDEGVTEITFTTTERLNTKHGYNKKGYNPSINQHSVPPGHDPNHPFHRNHFNNQQAEVLPGHDQNHPFHRHHESSGVPPGHDPNHPYHRTNSLNHQNSGVPSGHDPNHPYHRNHETSGIPHDPNPTFHRTNNENHQNSGVPPGHDPNHPFHRNHQNSGVPPGHDPNHPFHRNHQNSGVPPGHDPNHPFHRNHQNSGVPPGHDPNHPFHRQGTNGHQGHHPPGYDSNKDTYPYPLDQHGNSHVPPGHNPNHPYHRRHHQNNRHENEQNCTDSRHFVSQNPQETTTSYPLPPVQETTLTNFGFMPRRDTFDETTIRPRGTSPPRTTPKIINYPITTHRTLTNKGSDFPEYTTPTPRGNPINVLPLYPTYPNPTEDNPCDGMFKCSYNKCISFDKVCDGRTDCDDRRDETNCPAIGYEARLSSENGNKHEGRVEIKVYNQWGYICDDKFGMRDATVLCKELGYELGASEVRPNSFYGPNKEFQTTNKTLFIMDELDCLGNETSLQECQFNGWGVHDCNSEEIVGVVCKIPVMTCPPNYWLCETSQECIPIAFLCDNVLDCGDHTDENENHCNAKPHIRLTDGSSDLEGRVEIKYHGLWGTICDDDFGDKEASVICRNLGYGGASTVVKSHFGPGVGPIWLDQVSCSGNETNIEDCVHWHWGEHNCAHTEDVGVRCSDGPVVVKPPARRPTGIKTSNQFEPYVSVEQEVVFYQNERRAGRLLPEQCGQVKIHNVNDDQEPQFRVIKGTTAKKGEHPWQATIRVKGQGKSSHWCGAVLISKFHLLTAAHCLIGFPKGAYFIRLGDHHSEIEEPSEVEVFIENLYIHEDFRKGQHMNNDLAIIVLKSPVRFNDYIQPICMPTIDAAYIPGMNCTISGWGSVQSGVSTPSLDLRAAPIPILEDNVCKQPQVYGNVITDGMFCAGSLDEGVDACDGDSGGPLVCINDRGSHTLYGIISWGQHCGFANKPGVYVKIAKYIDWIKEKLNDSMINYGV